MDYTFLLKDLHMNSNVQSNPYLTFNKKNPLLSRSTYLRTNCNLLFVIAHFCGYYDN